MSAKHSVLGLFLSLCGIGDRPSGERGLYQVKKCIGVDAYCVPDETVAVWVHGYGRFPSPQSRPYVSRFWSSQAQTSLLSSEVFVG